MTPLTKELIRIEEELEAEMRALDAKPEPARPDKAVFVSTDMARPLRESVCADYAQHLEAAMQTGELSAETDVRYLTDLLAAVLRDCKWPSVKLCGGGTGVVDCK